jgi:hypothetical protein
VNIAKLPNFCASRDARRRRMGTVKFAKFKLRFNGPDPMIGL